MNSIILLIETIYCNIFRCNNLRRKKLFVFVFSILAISIQFWRFSKKIWPYSWWIIECTTPKKVVRQMSKKSRFREPFGKYHGKQAESLLKSERGHLYHIYWSLWSILSWKTSLLWICKILGLFVNPLTADHKFSVLNRDILLQHLQMILSQKRKNISHFFFQFGTLDSILNLFKKKMTLIADIFLNLRTPKNVVR